MSNLFQSLIPNLSAQRLASINGLLWAIGSGLLGSQLVTYLAQEFHIERIGASVGLILAAPHFVGVLRLTAPAIIGGVTDRKTFCIGCFIALADFVLSGVPLLAVFMAKQLLGIRDSGRHGRYSSFVGAATICLNIWDLSRYGHGWLTSLHKRSADVSWAAARAGWPLDRQLQCSQVLAADIAHIGNEVTPAYRKAWATP